MEQQLWFSIVLAVFLTWAFWREFRLDFEWKAPIDKALINIFVLSVLFTIAFGGIELLAFIFGTVHK